jgi:hypothetical protein
VKAARNSRQKLKSFIEITGYNQRIPNPCSFYKNDNYG